MMTNDELNAERESVSEEFNTAKQWLDEQWVTIQEAVKDTQAKLDALSKRYVEINNELNKRGVRYDTTGDE